MGGKRILLENEKSLLRAMEESFFGRSGFTLLVAENERQAFEMIEERDPDLAIFHLDRPGFSGEKCCRQVKEDPILRATPVLLVSPPEVEQLARCERAGCDGILQAPIDPLDLMRSACRVLDIATRGAPRIEVRLDLRCGRNPDKLRPGKILNLTTRGAFIASAELFPADSRIVLEFSAGEEGHLLRLEGRVAWVNHPEWIKNPRLPSGMGVQFLPLALEQVEVLRALIDRHNACDQ